MHKIVLAPNEISKRLRGAGLRPTRQRVALATLLFEAGDRHVTAELLHEEALQQKVPVSLATVYNTLHQFTEAGLLREVAVEGAKTYFDTNTSNHYHFFCENSGKLLDIETGEVHIAGLARGARRHDHLARRRAGQAGRQALNLSSFRRKPESSK